MLRTLGLLSIALCLGAIAFSTSRADEVKVGDAAPSFEATDDQGKPWKSSDHVGKKVIVVYFYPGDFTGGERRRTLGSGCEWIYPRRNTITSAA